MPILDPLLPRRNPDGGYGPVRGAASEPEPTALAGIARDDPEAAAWLEDHQFDDGSIGIRAGSVFRDLTSVSVLALDGTASQRAAIGWILSSRARAEPSTDALPHDPELRGGSWTSDTFGWTEPTAWAVLALRVLTDGGPELDDGIALLRDRECVGGGWNYGNRVVLGEELPPFVQTTGLALLALAGLDDPVVPRGIDVLTRTWRDEAQGVLSLAVAAAALRLYEQADSPEAATLLARSVRDGSGVDTLSLAWSQIALGDGLARLETW